MTSFSIFPSSRVHANGGGLEGSKGGASRPVVICQHCSLLRSPSSLQALVSGPCSLQNPVGGWGWGVGPAVATPIVLTSRPFLHILLSVLCARSRPGRARLGKLRGPSQAPSSLLTPRFIRIFLFLSLCLESKAGAGPTSTHLPVTSLLSLLRESSSLLAPGTQFLLILQRLKISTKT